MEKLDDTSHNVPQMMVDEHGNKIINPQGMGLLRLSMMVITASICGGIFRW